MSAWVDFILDRLMRSPTTASEVAEDGLFLPAGKAFQISLGNDDDGDDDDDDGHFVWEFLKGNPLNTFLPAKWRF